MSESIALTQKKQKSFSKSVLKTKQKIKKGNIKVADKVRNKFEKSDPGTLYVGNIPHGFYEKELRGYFGQFGNIDKVRVCRSHKTGNSRGYAFIHFKEKEIAKIAAETMNNYLMGKRLLKAKVVTDESKSQVLFERSNFSKERYPTKVRREKFKKNINAAISEEKYKDKTIQAIRHINDVKNKLKEMGIDYDFTLHIPKSIAKSEQIVEVKENKDSEELIQNEEHKDSEELIQNEENKDSEELIQNEENKDSEELIQNEEPSIVEKVKKKKEKKIKEIFTKKGKAGKTKEKKIQKNELSSQNTENENTENNKQEKKKRNLKNNLNVDNENNQNIKREKKMKKQNKQSEQQNIENNMLEFTKKLKSKQGKMEKKNELQKNKKKDELKKVEGIRKRSKAKKIIKISNNKANLIKEQIKTNNQVKTVKKIKEKKKNITKS